jgi:hypothetical protein
MILFYDFHEGTQKTSEIHNTLISVPPEIRMRHFEDTTDKRYGLSKLAPYEFLLNQSNVTGV